MSAEETYDLKTSLQIVCKWCGQQNIFFDDLLYDLKLMLADSKYRIIAFNGPPDDGKRFLFTSLIGAGYNHEPKHACSFRVYNSSYRDNDFLVIDDSTLDGGSILKTLVSGYPLYVDEKRIDLLGSRPIIILSDGSLDKINTKPIVCYDT